MLERILSIPMLVDTTDLTEDTLCGNATLLKIIAVARLIIRIIQIAVPILLIVLGSIDIAKAVIAGDEKKIKEAQKPFVKRIVAAVIVFLIPFLVGVIFNLVKAEDWKNCYTAAKDKSISDIFSGNPYEIPDVQQ